jgi:hypothetical protein
MPDQLSLANWRRGEGAGAAGVLFEVFIRVSCGLLPSSNNGQKANGEKNASTNSLACQIHL